MYVTARLGSEELPRLIGLNVKRLTHGYNVLISTLRDWGVEFLPVGAGLLVYAKLVKNALTWEDEGEFVKKLLENRVQVSPGRLSGGINGEKGWVRIAFSVREEDLRKGLGRIAEILESA